MLYTYQIDENTQAKLPGFEELTPADALLLGAYLGANNTHIQEACSNPKLAVLLPAVLGENLDKCSVDQMANLTQIFYGEAIRCLLSIFSDLTQAIDEEYATGQESEEDIPKEESEDALIKEGEGYGDSPEAP